MRAFRPVMGLADPTATAPEKVPLRAPAMVIGPTGPGLETRYASPRTS